MPTPRIEERFLVIPAGIERDGVKYDILIAFHLEGRRIDAKMPVQGAEREIQGIVDRCLISLEEQLKEQKRDAKNLEQLGFYVESGPGSEAAKTSALVAQVGGSIFQSLEKVGDLKDKNLDTSKLLSSPKQVQESQEKGESRTVHGELLSLKQLLTHDFISVTRRNPSPLLSGQDDDDVSSVTSSDDCSTSDADESSTGGWEIQKEDENKVYLDQLGEGLATGDLEINKKRVELLNQAVERFKEKRRNDQGWLGRVQRLIFSDPWMSITLNKLSGKNQLLNEGREQFDKAAGDFKANDPVSETLRDAFAAFAKKEAGEGSPELEQLFDGFKEIAWPFYEDSWKGSEESSTMDRLTAEHCKKRGSTVSLDDRQAYAKHLIERDFIKPLIESWKEKSDPDSDGGV